MSTLTRVSVFTSFLRCNYLVIVLAFLTGALTVAPALLARMSIGEEYQGLPFIFHDNEDYYLANMKEISEGYLTASSPHFYENKDAPVIVPPVGEYLYVLLSKISGISLPDTLVLTKFLFPAILFILIYLFFNLVTRNANASLIVASLATIGYDLVDYRYLFKIIFGDVHNTVLSVWTRPVNPITGALFLFAFLSLLWLTIEKKKWRYSIPAGVILGLSVGYFFTLALALTITACLVVICFIRKQKEDIKHLLGILLVAGLIDISYWLGIIKSIFGEGGDFLATRNGMLFTHQPILNLFLATTTLFFLISTLMNTRRLQSISEQSDSAWWFLVAILSAGFIVYNQQIITGRAIWPYHFVQYTIPLCFAVIIFTWTRFWQSRMPRLGRILAGGIILSIISYGIFSATTFRYKLNDFRKHQTYVPVFNWINQNTEQECVILVYGQSWRMIQLIPGFTHCNVYSTTATNYGTPYERAVHNFLINMRLDGVLALDARKYLEDHKHDLLIYFYNDWSELHGPKPFNPEPIIDKLTVAYQSFAKQDIRSLLELYRLDYIITVGTSSVMQINEAVPGLKTVFTSSDMIIYKFQ